MNSPSIRPGFAGAFAASLVLSLGVPETAPAQQPDIPPAVDPGTPEFTESDDPVPDAPVAFDPSINMLEAIHGADVAAGGESFWIDRVLERPAGGSGGNTLYTKGSAQEGPPRRRAGTPACAVAAGSASASLELRCRAAWPIDENRAAPRSVVQF